MQLFKSSLWALCPILHANQPIIQPLIFCSTKEVWQDLERILNKIFHLTQQNRQQTASACESSRHKPDLLHTQQHVGAELARWLDMYNALKGTLRGQRHSEEEKHDQLLGAYHTMATIMAETCLQPSDEMVFDSSTNQFLQLVRHLPTLKREATIHWPVHNILGCSLDISRSIIDMGWIPPLFYAATKCRIHQIRIQAIRLLDSTFHRAGIWDSRIAACVARKVMVAEELDFYEDIDTADGFPLLSSPRPEDLLLPTLPAAYRLREVEMILSDAPMDKILLFYSHRALGEGENRRLLLSEYDVQLQCWIDGGG